MPTKFNNLFTLKKKLLKRGLEGSAPSMTSAFDDSTQHKEVTCQREFLTPCLALSSLYADATSLNFWPSLSLAIASIIFECFSHKICRTF